MALLSLSVRDFRCFATADLKFAPRFNLIIGENASGKTSLLEAIFLLGRGRSFRTSNLGSAIRGGAADFRVSGKATGRSGPVNIGLVRDNRQLQIKIAGRVPENLASLAEAFPVQFMDSHAHQLISGGPRHRRQFLDWGVFHVEPAFFQVWRRYQRALKQRNALLRAGSTHQEIASWDAELASSGGALDSFRRRYLESLSFIATTWTEQTLGGLQVEFGYKPGWSEGKRLVDALKDSTNSDRQTGMTQSGPHRAELSIRVEGKLAQERISRGQEKALAGALLLAQAALYRNITSQTCTLLLDDLAAELDANHLARFMERVEETGAQAFITAIELSSLFRCQTAKVFHVKQGEISEMI